MSSDQGDESYRSLNPEQISATVDRLRSRIEDRFPNSGLGKVCGQLSDISRQAQDRARRISEPIVLLRLGIWTLVAIFFALGFWSFTLFKVRGGRIQRPEEMSTSDLLQAVDAGTHELLVLGAGVFSLISIERRMKRNRAMRVIHELRSMAHIIDMHQLTKDPERLLKRWVLTEHSPRPEMTAFELARYLDYCSEMLSVIGKIASLYVQQFDDAITISSVNDIEDLTTGLSRKVWQKIAVLNSYERQGDVEVRAGDKRKRPVE